MVLQVLMMWVIMPFIFDAALLWFDVQTGRIRTEEAVIVFMDGWIMGDVGGAGGAAQNVHQHDVQLGVSNLWQFVRESASHASEEQVESVKRQIKEDGGSAWRGWQRIMTHQAYITNLEANEHQVLLQVVKMIAGMKDEQTKRDATRNLILQLRECAKSNVCPTGRVSRVLEVISHTFMGREGEVAPPVIVTEPMLEEVMAAKIPVLSRQLLRNHPRLLELWLSGEEGPQIEALGAYLRQWIAANLRAEWGSLVHSELFEKVLAEQMAAVK
jgi:hypothetical protein